MDTAYSSDKHGIVFMRLHCIYISVLGNIPLFGNQQADMKLYKIFADYRPKNSVPRKHYYYVYGRNKRDAKRRFQDRITWLKIYEVGLYEGEPLDPVKNIVF